MVDNALDKVEKVFYMPIILGRGSKYRRNFKDWQQFLARALSDLPNRYILLCFEIFFS